MRAGGLFLTGAGMEMKGHRGKSFLKNKYHFRWDFFSSYFPM
jgi:hypothetical protein